MDATVWTVSFHLAFGLSAFGARSVNLRRLFRASIAVEVRSLLIMICVFSASSKLIVLLVFLIVRSFVRVLAALPRPAVLFFILNLTSLRKSALVIDYLLLLCILLSSLEWYMFEFVFYCAGIPFNQVYNPS